MRMPAPLTDDALPQAIKILQEQGAIVAGITSRESSIIAVTLKQLKAAGLHFDNHPLPDGAFDAGSPWPVTVRRGVIFCGNGNTKGRVIAAALKQKKFRTTPAAVTLIDDRKEHLTTTRNALLAHNPQLPFTPVLCTFPDEYHTGTYRDAQAKRELLTFVYQSKEDPQIKTLIGQDPFTREFIAEQCTPRPADEDKHICRSLLQLQKTLPHKETSREEVSVQDTATSPPAAA